MQIDKYTFNPVFITSLLVVFFVTLFASVFPIYLNNFFNNIQVWISTNLGWVYILSVGVILLLSIYLCFSRLGDIKLGQDHEQPEFKNLSWFSMLFSAGMGIGLMFWGVAEPIMHLSHPPIGEAFSLDSAKSAMQITFFHWGIHAWAIYSMLAVTLAYFAYRKDLPLLPRSIFYPLLGKKIFGVIGNLIDIFTIISTIFGVASSLGLGVSQINAGLNYLFGIEEGIKQYIILIISISLISVTSVAFGIEKGMKRLSNINVAIAIALMSAILCFGDSIVLLQSFVQNTGSYFSSLIHKTFNLYAYERKESWIGGWTLLYWGWWVSWSPFVAMFIARISKGRTVREFMLGVLFTPTIFTFLWMTIFGNSAISIAISNEGSVLIDAVNNDITIALFKFLEFFPFTPILSFLGVILIITFFVSSADSGALVITTLATNGEEDPPIWQKILWSSVIALVASTLLLAGGINALQTMTIITASPVLVVILMGAFCLIKSLREDVLLQISVKQHNTVLQYSNASSTWRERLQSLVMHPQKKEVANFINNIVVPALEELAEEMNVLGMNSSLERSNIDSIVLKVEKEEAEDFYYEINVRKYEVPEYSIVSNEKFYRAEVFLLSGGQGYDVFGYTKQQIIADALTQYEKHVHFLHQSIGEKCSREK
ncbi:unnamed protein product [Ectocarpus sp. 12 AP-2014]